MPAIKLNISLDESVARTMRQQATEAGKSTSRYLADLIVADARRAQDDLAAEGYRSLSGDTAAFAADAWAAAQQTWPSWDDGEDPQATTGVTELPNEVRETANAQAR